MRAPHPWPVIQIAGIRSLPEARAALDAGATHLGFPLRLPVHRADVSEAEAAKIIHFVGGSRCALITYDTRPEDVAALCAQLGVSVLQMHADLPAATLAEIRRRLPDVAIWKSLVVRADRSPDDLLRLAAAWAEHADAFLTDSHDPRTGATGATGRTHDWSISRSLAAALPRPLILAGGLRPENVADAIRTVRPAGVDSHTGVEDATGAKNPGRMTAFVRAAREAYAALAVT